MNDPDKRLRKHLDRLLSGEGAHVSFDKAVADLSPEKRGAKLKGEPHTPWRVVEHMRIAQWDILEFSRNHKHESPEWPTGYWPDGDAPPDEAAWDRTVRQFKHDLAEMRKLIADPAQDLFKPFAYGEGQDLCREALTLADHNAYHLGQLILLRRALGAWKE